MDHPTRKKNRLANYDYASSGSYFITICTRNKEKLFGSVMVNCDECRMKLSLIGRIVRSHVQDVPKYYPSLELDHFVVMPNHVHLLLTLKEQGMVSVSRVINQLKGSVTKEVGQTIWQKLYHDRIVRNQEEYLKIWNYIDTNPQKWMQDCFYCE